jgi:hypothetical protein
LGTWRIWWGRVGAGVACVIALVSPASAVSQQAGDVRYVQAAGVLVMPFDTTSGRVSFAIVSRTGNGTGGPLLQTHWVFYAADCRHLADVFVGLTDLDTVVVDPTRLQGQTQTVNPSVNHPQGPTVDLSGERGVVIVTALGTSGQVLPQIVGGWTIADPGTGASFGGAAIGISADGTLPDPTLLAGGIRIPTFDPTTLTNSQVILIGLESDGGELHPITRASAALGGAHVCCAASVTDNLEVSTSIPDVCFDCVGFAAFTPALASAGETALLPDGVALTTAGFVRLAACRSATGRDETAPVGTGDTEQFLVVLHGQAVGRFGFAVTGKYSRATLD